MRNILLVLLAVLLSQACANDDDGLGGTVVPPRLLTEVSAEDDAEIQDFLRTHTYNYEEFENPPADFDFKIRIDTLAGDNADKTPLSDLVQSEVVNVSSIQFPLIEEENDVPHTFYYLSAKEGEGLNPTTADSVLVKYEGMVLNGAPFDASTSFTWFNQASNIRGFANGIAKFRTGTTGGIIENPDGTTDFTNSGVGLIIMPSGLGYFNGNGGSNLISAYSSLIFQVNVGLTIVDTDTDQDGIPNRLEDLNGNDYFFDDNTDSQVEASAGFPATANFRDSDDDGDGIPTREEISDADGNIIFPYPDDDNNGIDDYLDVDFQRTVGDN
ncbi:hypothetical protein [Allomuricauda sp. d1]|uniref:FKBP-type peptidyl-prolyl cis-trans isomerase n=1 Tax=Allomuricauda sp. d1 TaxID=3136725 RepID=UPI0031E0FBAF